MKQILGNSDGKKKHIEGKLTYNKITKKYMYNERKYMSSNNSNRNTHVQDTY